MGNDKHSDLDYLIPIRASFSQSKKLILGGTVGPEILTGTKIRTKSRVVLENRERSYDSRRSHHSQVTTTLHWHAAMMGYIEEQNVEIMLLFFS